MLARFLWGALNGNLGVIKTVVSEVSDDSNRARSFSTFGISGGIARLIGPACGGFLYGYQLTTKGTKHLLPCLIAAGIAIVAWILAFCFLEETKDNTLTISKNKREATLLENINVNETNRESILGSNNSNSNSNSNSNNNTQCTKMCEMLHTPSVLIPTSLYGLFALASTTMNELLPLYLINTNKNGGFNFHSIDLGMIYLACGPAQILNQIFVFHRMSNWLGSRKLFIVSNTIVASIYFLFPLISFAANGGDDLVINSNNTSNNTATSTPSSPSRLVLVTCIWIVLRAFSLFSFTAVCIMIAQGSTNEERSRANGLGQTFVGVSRVIGPSVGAVVFAWSCQGEKSWPFNHSLVWHAVGLVGFGTSLWARKLPLTIDKQKKK